MRFWLNASQYKDFIHESVANALEFATYPRFLKISQITKGLFYAFFETTFNRIIKQGVLTLCRHVLFFVHSKLTIIILCVYNLVTNGKFHML